MKFLSYEVLMFLLTESFPFFPYLNLKLFQNERYIFRPVYFCYTTLLLTLMAVISFFSISDTTYKRKFILAYGSRRLESLTVGEHMAAGTRKHKQGAQSSHLDCKHEAERANKKW